MHIVTAEIVSTALCFEDNFEIILVGFTYNCLNLLFANVDKLNIKQEKMNTLRWFFFLRNLRPQLFPLISQQGYSSFSYFFYFSSFSSNSVGGNWSFFNLFHPGVK